MSHKIDTKNFSWFAPSDSTVTFAIADCPCGKGGIIIRYDQNSLVPCGCCTACGGRWTISDAGDGILTLERYTSP